MAGRRCLRRTERKAFVVLRPKASSFFSEAGSPDKLGEDNWQPDMQGTDTGLEHFEGDSPSRKLEEIQHSPSPKASSSADQSPGRQDTHAAINLRDRLDQALAGHALIGAKDKHTSSSALKELGYGPNNVGQFN